MNQTRTDCPDREILKQFVLGRLPVTEIEGCELHLEQCDPCVETIAGLKVGDTFTGMAEQALAENALNDDADDLNLIEKMISNVSDWKHDSRQLETEAAGPVSMDRAAEVQRLLREPIVEGDLGAIDHYRILELIGTGSTGIVYLAIDTKLERQAVLKVLRPSLGESARTRFIAEAKATAAIHHPNVVMIYEVSSDGPLSYIAMQWIPGRTLEQKLAEEETLSIPATRLLVEQIAGGLDAAHGRGLIHRDIKPANIWIPDGDEPAKILDFGLVRVNDENPQLTCTGMIAGTPCFMSPEQSRGDKLDVRSDLFSLGCLMYQCLTGQLPFRSDNALATLRSIQMDQPTAPVELDPAIDSETSELVMCLLEKLPNRRPTSASSLIRALKTDSHQWEFEVAEHRAATRPKRKVRSSWWKSVAALFIGVVLASLGFAYGQQIIRIAMNEGEIVIETKVDNVKIEVVGNGEIVSVIDLATEQSINIKAGEYEIRPVGDKNSISIDKNQLTLSRGETEIVTIRRNQIGDINEVAADPTAPYRLDSGDVLGIFIDGVLGSIDSDPPIHQPEPGSGSAPAIGFPIAVEHNGKISLPYIDPVSVRGKTIVEVRAALSFAYKGEPAATDQNSNASAVNNSLTVIPAGDFGDTGSQLPNQSNKTPVLRDNARILVNLIRRRPSSSRPEQHSDLNKSKKDNQNFLLSKTKDPGNEAFSEKENPEQRVQFVTEFSKSIAALERKALRDRSRGNLEILLEAYERKLDLMDELLLEEKVDPVVRRNYQLEYPGLVQSSKRLKSELNATLPMKSDKRKMEFEDAKLKFENGEIDQLQFWAVEKSYQESILQSHVITPDSKRKAATRLIEIAEQRLDQLNRLEARDESQWNRLLADRASAIRFQTDWEREAELPVSQPIYDGKTYLDWLKIAKTERDLNKLNPALKGIANLADKYQKKEMLDTMMQLVRRGMGIASEEQSNEFGLTFIRIVQSLDIESRFDLLIDELKTDDRGSVITVLLGNSPPYLRPSVFAIGLNDAESIEAAKRKINQLLPELKKFSTTERRASLSLRFLQRGFRNHWKQLGLDGNPIACELILSVIEAQTKPSPNFSLSGLSEMLKLLPKQMQVEEVNSILQATLECWQTCDKEDQKTIVQESLSALRNVFPLVDIEDLPKSTIVELANVLFQNSDNQSKDGSKISGEDKAKMVWLLGIVDVNWDEFMRKFAKQKF